MHSNTVRRTNNNRSGSETDANPRHPVRSRGTRRRVYSWMTLLVLCVFLLYVLYSISPTSVVLSDPAKKSQSVHAGSFTTVPLLTTATPLGTTTEEQPSAPSEEVLTGTEAAVTSSRPTSYTEDLPSTTAAPPPPPPSRRPTRTYQPDLTETQRKHQAMDGEYEPEEPWLLPGLEVRRRRYTPEELHDIHHTMTLVYSFVNGTELNHYYRKKMVKECVLPLLNAEEVYWNATGPRATVIRDAATVSAAGDEADDAAPAADYLAQPQTTLPATASSSDSPPRMSCRPTYMKSQSFQTLGDLVRAVGAYAVGGSDNRDRETDELRHSFRSVEQHMRWHRGRVVMVSPGHHPQWVDPAKNFLAGQCGGAEGAAVREGGGHLRVTTVHQDALLPYGMRLTVDSHVIEQNLWRVANITPVHIYLNDDYFINRDVAVTDIINEYGGTIVRTENGVVAPGVRADNSASWYKGVLNTQAFNTMELDVHHEDYLPPALLGMWREHPSLLNNSGTSNALLDEAVDVARAYPPEELPDVAVRPRRVRHYATHAPFVYCTNMFRFLNSRYEREFARNALNHRGRKAADLFVPFVYNAFIMARPWQASPQFLPYLVRRHMHNNTAGGAAEKVVIDLNNEDGCAPATLRWGQPSSGCVFAKFLDNTTLNVAHMKSIEYSNALFFNINAGFSSEEAAAQLRDFLRRKFAQPAYLELPLPAAAATPAPLRGELTALFDALMALPVVVLTSFEEGVCPAVRSLQLALPRHSGRVVAVRQRHGHGEVDATLEEVRAALQHRVRSAMPVPRCAFSARVRVSEGVRGASTAELVRGALAEEAGAGAAGGDHAGDQDGAHDGDDSEGGVLLPSACGGGGGVRVRAVVVDARTGVLPVPDAVALRQAIAMPGQTLALEDFSAVRLDGGAEGDVALVLSRGDAVAKGVHWIGGASEGDLLLTYPVPYAAYEDMSAPLQWV